jgi:glutamine amidotransferase
MIHIIDYGLGNIKAFLSLYRTLNIKARTAENAESLRGATHVILPGVGHFDHAMDRLQSSGMREPLEEMVNEKKVAVLGVCVGMQILAVSSDEGTRPGLGWVNAHVRAFSGWEHANALPVPHMGWNDVVPRREHPLFTKMEGDRRFYFLHSYFFDCRQADDVLAEAEYGAKFACAIHRDNILGVQFHPEKSHRFGTRLLQNFAEL